MSGLEPLKQWICDSCYQVIQGPENGWLEWYEDENEKLTSFRIVHHRKNCQYDDDKLYKERKFVQDLQLDEFIGPDGLVRLLGLLEHNKLADVREVIEMIRRLHIPYYEEARQYFTKAKEDGFFDGANEIVPYFQRELLDVISIYSK